MLAPLIGAVDWEFQELILRVIQTEVFPIVKDAVSQVVAILGGG